jgi:hypothetical protein
MDIAFGERFEIFRRAIGVRAKGLPEKLGLSASYMTVIGAASLMLTFV